ncbi:MAG: COQ9 family protein [Rhodospirillaceae bacterium]|jgi:ubiquinone biosynthesis protein COQ9|nr:COQ9 family protein [Rhodospirillaceae bacterium]MBT5245583.1 COQ9 family protein [Rhodospirillaceae bacterium]MBT5561169.1 COQ9 family protein [Rhodospirillaceae bacterium]MBT6242863.1 COQ9 family protein [Rhodospirillaceae bacterium]MBT7136328.1 COQ9 family protein [Rhodospirillaceae bacterium]
MNHQNQELRDLILLATLPHVVFEGWSQDAVAAGIEDLQDLPGIEAEGAIKDMSDLAAHFSDWTDRRMVAEMAKIDMPSLKIRQRIASGVRCRLEIMEPHREAVRRCLTYMTLPHNAGLSLKSTYNTVNEIWYATGDESADFSFYSKRALLAPVLASTILYWLADEGDGEGDYPETWEFLDRRIADVLKLIQTRIKITDRLAAMSSPVDVCKRFAATVQVRR